jgi:putative addiction module killer protein
MNTLIRTAQFSAWLKGLKDPKGVASILARIDRAQKGNFGDSKSLKGGLSEMRVDVGPGYRVYFTQRGQTVYVLLAGGDKRSQDRDIAQAREMMKLL